jgi:hypothetical protein
VCPRTTADAQECSVIELRGKQILGDGIPRIIMAGEVHSCVAAPRG